MNHRICIEKMLKRKNYVDMDTFALGDSSGANRIFAGK